MKPIEKNLWGKDTRNQYCCYILWRYRSFFFVFPFSTENYSFKPECPICIGEEEQEKKKEYKMYSYISVAGIRDSFGFQQHTFRIAFENVEPFQIVSLWTVISI